MDFWRYRRLVYNVKKAYPYAKLAAEKLEEIDYNLSKIKSEKKQKNTLKKLKMS
jgi:Lhr-like helicase